MKAPEEKTCPKVSVVIPAYKHANVIEQTLESVFQQTFQDFEVIVINDGSPDETHSRLEKYVGARRIRYKQVENGGQARARNLGISIAHGLFVILFVIKDAEPLIYDIGDCGVVGRPVVQ